MCSKRDQVALHVGIYCTARDATRQREYSELNQPLCGWKLSSAFKSTRLLLHSAVWSILFKARGTRSTRRNRFPYPIQACCSMCILEWPREYGLLINLT